MTTFNRGELSADHIAALNERLTVAAGQQDQYDLDTINLIAPASPTLPRYCDDLPLKHNAIAEGLLENRPYAGVKGFNEIESIAVEAAKLLFRAEHANVQPHSVSQANQAAYQAVLEAGDKVLAMRFDAGGHLTHGHKGNFSGRFFDFDFYGLGQDGLIDYEEIRRKALEARPRMIVCGASSYPREIEFERLGAIAQEAGAYLMADLSHPAGLIAAGRFPEPFPHCDIVTLTMDKTMLGPHGGIILCKDELRRKVDAAVHPGVQSSIPLRRIYAMAQCMLDAAGPDFRDYIDRVLANMKVFEREFTNHERSMVTGGSSTHLAVIDTLNTFGLTGKEAETLLESLNILTNRQVIPGETLKPYEASGIRLGTSWITARGFSEDETAVVASRVVANLAEPTDERLQATTLEEMKSLAHVTRDKDVWHE